LKIVVANIIAEDRIGGPQLRILQVARKLKGKGIETIVVVPDNNGDFKDILKRDNIKVYSIKNFRRLRFTLNPLEHVRYILSFIPSIVRIRRIIKEESVDIVHQNDIRQIQGPIAAKLADVKVLWHLNGIAYPLITKLFIPFAYFLADKIIAASGAIGDGYFDSKTRVFRRDFDIVYAPVNTDRFHPGIDSSSFKEEFGLNNAYPVIGMVGNLNPIKGHGYFIEAAKLIKEKYKDAKFIIVGKRLGNRNDYINRLEGLARDLGLANDIVFTGERRDVPEVVSSFDVFVLPSLSEACPMALLEAMAVEKPCIAADVGGVPEIVKDKETGLLVPPKDHKAIASAVEFLLKNPEEAKAMGKKGREHIMSRFTLDICVDSHYSVYKALTGKNRAN